MVPAVSPRNGQKEPSNRSRSVTARSSRPSKSVIRKRGNPVVLLAQGHNRIKALVKFTAAPLLPGYDLPRLERQWGFPEPHKPTFSLADETWRDEHSQLMARQPRTGQTLRVAS